MCTYMRSLKKGLIEEESDAPWEEPIQLSFQS